MNKLRTMLWVFWVPVFFVVFIVAFILDPVSTMKLIQGYSKYE